MFMATAVSEWKELDEIRAAGWQDQGGSFWRPRVAEVVCDNVECGYEGVHIDHEESVPIPWGSASKPTLKGRHLPLKSWIYNSYQAFKVPKNGHMAYARRYSGRYTATG